MVRLCDPPSVNNKLKFEKEALVSPCQKFEDSTNRFEKW